MSALPIQMEVEVLSTENRQYTNKAGEAKEFKQCTVWSPITGAVATFGVANDDVLERLEASKRCTVVVDAEYNTDYKSVRITGVTEVYGD